MWVVIFRNYLVKFFFRIDKVIEWGFERESDLFKDFRRELLKFSIDLLKYIRIFLLGYSLFFVRIREKGKICWMFISF